MIPCEIYIKPDPCPFIIAELHGYSDLLKQKYTNNSTIFKKEDKFKICQQKYINNKLYPDILTEDDIYIYIKPYKIKHVIKIYYKEFMQYLTGCVLFA